MPDPFEQVRSLPLPALAGLLSIDLTKFKARKGGELYGPCPIHKAKNNQTSFSYAADGKFNCFSCSAKGRGAIDLAKLALNIGFQQAVDVLGGISPTAAKKELVEAPIASDGVLKPYSGKYEKYKVPCPWLEARIPDAGVRERYGVFCYENKARKSAYSGRVMIPMEVFVVVFEVHK